MKKIGLKINTSNGRITDLAGTPVEQINVVNGDTVLLLVQFTETLTTTETVMNLSGILQGRFTMDDQRREAATLLTFQDQYNQGNYASYENLSAGRMTWLVDFGTDEIAAELGTEESFTGWADFTILDANDRPQTLGQIQVRIVAQIDNGAEGTPPPSSPTYLTAAEISAGYLAALQPLLFTSAGTIPAGLGRRWVYGATSPAGFTQALPSAATCAAGAELIIINTGLGTLTISPDGTETINGASGNQTLSARWRAYHLISDGTNWICPNQVNP